MSPSSQFTRGRLLVALPQLLDPNFARSVVFMFEHNDAGAAGVILNRPSPIAVNDVLPAWATLAADPGVVHLGGPVAVETVLGLALVDPINPPSGATVVGAPSGPTGIAVLGLDAEPAADMISPSRLFAGYAGWGGGQLESEMAMGGWQVVNAIGTDVVTPASGDLWTAVWQRQRGALKRLANYPDDPSQN